MLQDITRPSSVPTQSAWVGVGLLYLAFACQTSTACQPMAMHGGLIGLLAGVGLEQSRKRGEKTALLASSIQQHITLQTGGRIHDLTVSVSGNRACVEGYVTSYNLVQLARSAALDIVGSGRPSDLDFKIRVCKPARQC